MTIRPNYKRILLNVSVVNVNVEWLRSLFTAQQRHCQGKSTCTRARSPIFLRIWVWTNTFPMSARPAFIICQVRHIRRSFDADSAVTLVHAFVTSRVYYCNEILAVAPKTTTDRLQWMLNAAAQVVSDTKQFDQGLSQLMHQELHWLDIPERVNYKLGVLTHRHLLSKAPVYLSNCCIPVSQVATRQHLRSMLRCTSSADHTSTSSQHLMSLNISRLFVPEHFRSGERKARQSKAKICNGRRHVPLCPACANEK